MLFGRDQQTGWLTSYLLIAAIGAACGGSDHADVAVVGGGGSGGGAGIGGASAAGGTHE
jgi:hypothetical protein